MRITRLSFAGFGPYRDEQSIDFRAFEDDGIYLIGGRTGAGKSTILDAICFALYASVPRFEKGEARLRSDHSAPSDPTWVELEFTAGGRDYRVRRSPAFERPKARGEGTTVSAPTAHLFVREDGDWRGIAARPKDVGIELADIVQLTRDQFLQVILLAQNRFQRFLAAGHDERQDLLRSLFATERFSSFEDYLVERRKAVESELGAELDTVERLAQRARSLMTALPLGTDGPETEADAAERRLHEHSDDNHGDDEHHDDEPSDDEPSDDEPSDSETIDDAWFADAERSAAPARRRAEQQLRVADAALASADAADRRAQDIAARIRRRDTALAVRDLLDARAAADEAARRELDRARAAAPLWPLVAAWDTAIEQEKHALRARDAAVEAFAAIATAADDDPAGAADALTRELGSLAEALGEERSLAALEKEARAADDRLEATRRAVEAAAAKVTSLPSELESARAAVAAARAAADSLDDATAAVEGLKLQVAASHDVRSAEKEVRRAQEAELAAASAVTEASSRFEGLLRLRVAGAAGELAESLVEGEPCAVCGSTTHPAPAAPSPEQHVRDDDLDAARAARDDAAANAARASRTVRDAETRRTLALVASGGAAAAELEERLSSAESHRDACASASARLGSLEHTVERLVEQAARADADLAERTAERDRALETSTRAAERLQSVATRVAAARGDDSSVAERVNRITTIRDAASAAVDAAGALDDRSRERVDAATRLDDALSRMGDDTRFPDAAAVRDSRRTDHELRDLEKRVSAAAEERAANTAVLAEPDLADLPEIIPDTAEAAAALLGARADRDEALARLRSIEGIEADLAGVRTEALSALSAVDARRDEAEAIRGLANTVEGKAPNTRRMDLETFVLAAQLEQIIAAANRRFAVMTSGRFALEHDDALAYRNAASGLGLAIRDEYTGRSRPTASLSGGETFLAALALALGLAEVVTERAGGITLETLFIDEGFGSLDGETLEIAMSTLDELRAGGRTVGLISHVDAMKERIAARLTVAVDETGASHVRQRVDLPSGASTATP